MQENMCLSSKDVDEKVCIKYQKNYTKTYARKVTRKWAKVCKKKGRNSSRMQAESSKKLGKMYVKKETKIQVRRVCKKQQKFRQQACKESSYKLVRNYANISQEYGINVYKIAKTIQKMYTSSWEIGDKLCNKGSKELGKNVQQQTTQEIMEKIVRNWAENGQEIQKKTTESMKEMQGKQAKKCP